MYYIGIDLGGTNIAAGIVTEEGRIIHQESIPTKREREPVEILKDIAVLCKKVIADKQLSMTEVNSIGIGSPGRVDNAGGRILYANNISFDNTPVRTVIQEYISLPVFIENDANCAALAENIAGAAKGYKDSLTITLGTGVGGGLIIDHKIFTGSFFGGGEVGHHVIVVDGEACTCGRKGCWEAYASATALIREIKEAAIKHPQSKMMELVDGDVSKITAKTVFDAADIGDQEAEKVIHTYLRYVAEGLGNMVNILQPEIIVIGGGVCAQGDRILAPIRHMIKDMVYAGDVQTKLAIAELGNDAGIIGAAMLGLS